MKCLVTGFAGFIRSNLVDSLNILPRIDGYGVTLVNNSKLRKTFGREHTVNLFQ
jgi:nucleoside-diphosphate-sugar epimerase